VGPIRHFVFSGLPYLHLRGTQLSLPNPIRCSPRLSHSSV
jgi:hypothetical protein